LFILSENYRIGIKHKTALAQRLAAVEMALSTGTKDLTINEFEQTAQRLKTDIFSAGFRR
jgi:hypothetical protein